MSFTQCRSYFQLARSRVRRANGFLLTAAIAITSHKPTYRDSHYFATGTICWCAELLLDGPVIGKQINHALRRVFVEEKLDFDQKAPS
jgi:hypothetical protein